MLLPLPVFQLFSGNKLVIFFNLYICTYVIAFLFGFALPCPHGDFVVKITLWSHVPEASHELYFLYFSFSSLK